MKNVFQARKHLLQGLALSLALYAVYRRVNRRATGGNDVR